MSNLQGTTVPSNAFVEKVYINVDLSIEEVVSIIDSANLTYTFSYKYTVVDGIEISNMLGKTIIVNNEVIFRESDAMNTGDFVGWKEGFNGIVAVNKQNSYGTQNDALSSLFSITPLTPAQEGQVIVSKSKLTAIADNIRNQTGATGLITLDEMAKMKLGGGATITTKGGWSGTPVPNSGYVENIYFNTNLSVEEVVEIANSLKYDNSAFGSIYMVASLYEIENPKQIGIMNGNGVIAIIVGEDMPAFCSQDVFGLGFTGWRSDFVNPFAFNDNSSDLYDTGSSGDIPVGHQNDKLSSLISTTPFVQATGEEVLLEGEYDGSTVDIDVQAAGSWSGASGTPVPNSGYVENVYFNTELTNEEIITIIENANLTYDSEGYYYVYVSDTDTSNHISILKNDMGTFIYYDMYEYPFIWSSLDNEENGITKGWLNDFEGFIEVNDTLVSQKENFKNVGSQNQQLSSLFSITPFTGGSSEPCIDLKQYIDNKQIPLKFNLTNLSTGTDTSDATATSEDILLGKTAYVNDVKVVGTIEEYDGSYEGEAVEIKTGGVIEVSELPTENIQEGIIYKTCDKFTDIYIIYKDDDFSISTKLSENAQIVGCEAVDSKPADDIVVSDFNTLTVYLYYVKDEKDIFLYGNTGYGDMWISASLVFQQEGINVSFKGEISDDDIVIENGYYAYLEPSGYYQYDGTSWQRYKFKGQEVVVEPSKWEEQVIEPTGGNGYLSKVTVNKVTSDIDISITPDNIVRGRSILGVRGTALTFEKVHSASSLSFIDKIEGSYHMKPYIFHKINAHVIDITLGISIIGNDSFCDLDFQCFSQCKAHTIKLKGEGRLTTRLHHAGVNNYGNITLTPDCFRVCENLNKLVLDFPDFGPLPVGDEFPDLAIDFLKYTPIADGTGYIYVPDALVDTVKSLDGWSTYADQIKPLSELPQ